MRFHSLNVGGILCFFLGIIRFTQLVKLFEKQNADVARLNAELRSIVLPQMTSLSETPGHSQQVV